MARETLQAAGVGVDELDRVAVTVGPGSFTGLRVGLSFARALILGRNIPVIGVTTLEAIAANLDAENETHASAAVIDARRGQVYAQAFAGARALCAPFVAAPADAAHRLKEACGGRCLRLAGTGGALVAPHLAQIGAAFAASGAPEQPDPAVVARLAAGRAALSAPPCALYLRAPDAKPPAAAALS